MIWRPRAIRSRVALIAASTSRTVCSMRARMTWPFRCSPFFSGQVKVHIERNGQVSFVAPSWAIRPQLPYGTQHQPGTEHE